MIFHFTPVSSNRKLGPIPAVTISDDTCPVSCPLKDGGGCYAELGPLGIHWRKINRGDRGDSFSSLLDRIRKLPKNQIWRYGQAGDLPGNGDEIDSDMLRELAKANNRRPVIAYTHKPPTERNLSALLEAKALGFHVNLSADSYEEADELRKTGLSVVTLMPSEFNRGKKETLSEFKERIRMLNRETPEGTKVAICPATYTDTDCASCQACGKAGDRIIGFPAHGSRKSRVDELF